MSRYLRVVLAIYRKDAQLEARTRETFTAMAVFAIAVALIFNFAFQVNPRNVALVGPGIAWAAFTFTGVIGINRAFIFEKDRGTLEGLLLAPAGREAVYGGKLLGTLTLMLIVEALMVPVFLVFYDIALLSWWFVGTAVLATVGFAAVGTVFAAIAVHTRAREVLLPLLFLPIVMPVVVAAVSSTASALAGEGWSGVARWFSLMVAFDVVFLVVSSLAFEFVVEE
ncbi:MAG: heme ABC transporter permease CcmB [SAR202 cluster bacterium]|nr:heme ABC transporter permease CcmB [SAR202 cluster bacterium]